MSWLAFIVALTTAATARSEIAFDSKFALWGALSGRTLNNEDYGLNPGNRLARLPNESETLELRPDLQLKDERWKLTARPRLTAISERIEVATESPIRHTSFLLRWSEAFTTLSFSETLALTYGLQNFQWGPAEAASPSNRIFRDSIQAKDVLYVTKGRHLVRVNWTASRQWSEVFMFELSNNGNPEFEAREDFARKGLLKSEYSWSGGADYAGVIVGWRDRFGYWWGEYANLETIAGLSVYADVSHQQGSLAYYPNRGALGATVLSQSRRLEQRLYTFSGSGARYAFENGNDWRVEWIFQEAGYSATETAAAWNALTSQYLPQLIHLSENAKSAERNGLEFPGRNYLFSSLRFPNSFHFQNWTLYARVLHSLQDGSNIFYASSENAVGTRGTLFASVALSAGKAESELKGLIQLAATAGYRQDW